MPPKSTVFSEDTFNALDQALGTMRLPIYRLLAAILHMGNVNFENNDSSYAQITKNSNESFECAANLLKIDSIHLRNALLSRKFTVNSDNYTILNDALMAERTKKSIMKQIYNALFQFLIDNINGSCGTNFQNCINILDIAGFGKKTRFCS